MVGALLLFCVALVLFYFGFWIHNAVGLIFDLIGIVTVFSAWCLAANSIRRAWIDRAPQMGYIDYLQGLTESRTILEAKIAELESLKDRQQTFKSERADTRLKLLDAAIENRKLKLALVAESQYIINSRRKMSGIQALVQGIGGGGYSAELEKELGEAFVDLRDWTEQVPSEWKSAAGKKIRTSLDKMLVFHTILCERIEDRKVLAAVAEEGESAGSSSLEGVQELIEQTAFDTECDALDMEEVVSADEDYLRINTELRLARDGIRHDFPGETLLELDDD